MKRFLNRIWREDDGVLSFEWTVLVSLLTVGVVSGITAVRDATIDEFGDVALSMISLDQSYYIQPPLIKIVSGCGLGRFPTSASGSAFADTLRYADCTRLPMRVATGDIRPKIIEHDWDPDVIEDPLLPGPARTAPVDPAAPPATIN